MSDDASHKIEDPASYCASVGLVTHSPDKCVGQFCCIHNPSEHHMSAWPMRWRADAGKMERICEHGIGHPDPDDAAYWERLGQGHRNIHGCDGCCAKPQNDIADRLRNWRSVHLARLHLLMAEAADKFERLRLTDAERGAVNYFAVIHAVDGEPLCTHADTLRGLLERL